MTSTALINTTHLLYLDVWNMLSYKNIVTVGGLNMLSAINCRYDEYVSFY